MPKIKTHRGAAKRFKITGTGKVVYAQYVPEVASEPDYEPAIAALKGAL